MAADKAAYPAGSLFVDVAVKISMRAQKEALFIAQRRSNASVAGSSLAICPKTLRTISISAILKPEKIT